ncbi:uncharacterized protein TNCV_3846741 [Trichonephila clavipes]|nr:uncharacterized protein TNCV_3846741 [Trichonephila clavipes]
METHEENIANLLDCLISKATALSSNIKKNEILPSLQAKFDESVAQNGLNPQSNVVDQNMNNLIQLYKSRMSLDASRNQFQNSGVLDISDMPLPQSNSNYHPA